MTVGIYGIFEKSSGACLYVGQSKHVEARWRQHLTKLQKKRSHYLEAFIDWYHSAGGTEELLEFRLLEECEDDNALKNELEILWFEALAPRFYGKRPSLLEIWDHSAVTKERIAQSLLSLAMLKAQRLRVSCKHCGKVFEAIASRKRSYCSKTCSQAAMRKHSFTPEEEQDIVRRYRANEKLQDICSSYGTHGAAVMKILASHGVPTRHRAWVKAAKNRVSTTGLVEAGFTAGQVASHMHWHQQRLKPNDGCAVCHYTLARGIFHVDPRDTP